MDHRRNIRTRQKTDGLGTRQKEFIDFVQMYVIGNDVFTFFGLFCILSDQNELYRTVGLFGSRLHHDSIFAPGDQGMEEQVGTGFITPHIFVALHRIGCLDGLRDFAFQYADYSGQQHYPGFGFDDFVFQGEIWIKKTVRDFPDDLTVVNY